MDRSPGAPPGPTRLYFGIAACVQCHTRPGEPEPVLCRCTEAALWGAEDKHRDAFQVLRGERAREIGELLHFRGPVWQEQQCVSCHGVWVADQTLRHKTFKEEDGVSCVACHGAYREWVALHGDVLERDNWRGYSRQLKEEKYGMRDLWDPARRARLCASCHVGNAEEGKVVTHAMYGAGHPPLPGVEIATFSDAMPRHWQYLKEKKPEVQKMLGADPRTVAFEQTKLVAVSAAVVVREALSLLASEAALASEAGAKVVWPELALFDCAACHHELRRPSWRARPSSVGEPGQPRLWRWPTELAGVVLEAGDGGKSVWRERLGGLYQALDVRPFGRPQEVAAATRQAVAWLDERIPQLAAQPYDRAAALRLLHALCAPPPAGVPDYDSARQRLWAIQIIYQELAAAGPKPANDPAIRQILDTLSRNLKLPLPAGRKQSILAQLPVELKAREDYGPAELTQVLGELKKLLPAS